MSEDKDKKKASSEDLYHNIKIPDTFESEDDFFNDISESLKNQVNDQLGESTQTTTETNGGTSVDKEPSKKKMKHKGIKITGGVILGLLLVIGLLVGTRGGRKILINWGANIVADRMDQQGTESNKDNLLFTKPSIEVNPGESYNGEFRKEEYVANFLLFGLEEIGGGGRSDSMMIASVNLKDKTIKLTSLMRDCYVEIPGHGSNKLNAAYSFGGVDCLIDTVQQNFKIYIDGYASVNFDSFEKIIDRLGGVDIELGEAEAAYLRRTNYISNPSYRTVKAGWNTLNGNQALGYSRVRKVATLGGVNNDHGRTLRQRRVLNAIFDKYKSKNFIELASIMYDILPLIKTNLTSAQISDVLEQVVENGITKIDNYRLPVEDCYTDGKKSCGSVLLLDFDANIKKLYEYIFLDVEEPTVTPSTTVEGTGNTSN